MQRRGRNLWLGRVDAASAAGGYAAVVIPQGVTPANEPVLISTAHALPGVTFVDKAASVSTLFGTYRVDSGIWRAGALLSVLFLADDGALPPARRHCRSTLPVLLAVGVTLAVFGYAGV